MPSGVGNCNIFSRSSAWSGSRKPRSREPARDSCRDRAGRGVRLAVPADRNKIYESHIGKQVTFGLRPEHIHAANFAPPNIKASSFEGTVDVIELLGHELHLYITTGKSTFVATVDTRLAPTVGNTVPLVADMNNMHIFDKNTEQAIR